ncbi:unnamed protein product [Lupinus luteus]|uniref:Cystatin domain-containing protein n=1 Tax=Lupinus luteus TaxID=3873 RepID=A0AAV1WJN6_LUPLU
MRHNNLNILSIILFLSFSAVAIAGRYGGWAAINDANDTHVKEIADFAVTEHNKQSGENLKLESVIKGETQVVSGTNYRLVVTASNGTASKKYVASVYEKPWENYRNLTSFDPALY